MASTIQQIGYRVFISRRYRKRYREIVSTLLRHGFGFLVVQLGLARFIPFQYGILGHARRAAPYTRAEHIRLIFEELGTTFIKLGQILSARTDLLPPEYIHELEKLLDRVPPVGVELIQRTIQQELGRSTDEIFSFFDREPLASASIGQVHAAVLKTGESVVIKVKKPGVSEQVSVDIDIVTELARLATKRLSSGKNYDFEGIAKEFTQTLLRELNYVQEGRNADNFRDNFAGDERICIPRIYWDYTNENVIVIERISGMRINDKNALQTAGFDPKEIAKRSSDILFEQIFEHGFFHADPHPANFFVMADGVIGVVDFGMVGYLDRETKMSLAELFIAVYEQDPDAVIDSYIDLGVVGRIERFGELRNDISSLIMQYYGLTIEQINVRAVFNDATALVRRYNLRMPSNLALLTKTIGMEEGLVMSLDPNFSFTAAVAPFTRRVWEETYSPRALARRATRSISELVYLGIKAPGQIRRILGQVSKGELTVLMNQPRLDEELSIISSMVNRLIFGIVAAALFVTTGLLLPFFYNQMGERRTKLKKKARP